MNTNNNWDIIEGKLLELRILTNANWKNQEYELAALGERVLRSVESAKGVSESVRAETESPIQSADPNCRYLAIS
jgi:hypothetical protein